MSRVVKESVVENQSAGVFTLVSRCRSLPPSVTIGAQKKGAQPARHVRGCDSLAACSSAVDASQYPAPRHAYLSRKIVKNQHVHIKNWKEPAIQQ